MKILLANKNVWWKSGGQNQPGYKDEASMKSAIIAEYFDDKAVENLAAIKDTTPITWSGTEITVEIDKSALLKTKSGKYLHELLKSNYAIVQTGKVSEYFHVDAMKLAADKITVNLSRDIWVNDMSWRDGIDHEVYVDREHADRFIVENGVATGFDYSEGSPIHNYEDLQGFEADMLIKKEMVNPAADMSLGMDKTKVDLFLGLLNVTNATQITVAELAGKVKVANGYDPDTTKLRLLISKASEYAVGKSKWLRAFMISGKDGEAYHGEATAIANGLEVPMVVLTAPITSPQTQSHRVNIESTGAKKLYTDTASAAYTLGFQVVTYPEYSTLLQYKKDFNADTVKVETHFALKDSGDGLKAIFDEGGDWNEYIQDNVEIELRVWKDDGAFHRVDQRGAGGESVTEIGTNKLYPHPFDAKFIGITGTVSEASFEPKLNIAPFAKYSLGSAVNEGDNFEVNKFYNAARVSVMSLTSMSPESTAQRLILGTSYMENSVTLMDFEIGAYKETNLSSLGAHWSNPFYPPLVTDEWKQYVAGHKTSVISGAETQVGTDIGKFGMAIGAGFMTGGPIGAVMGAVAGGAASAAGEISFWSHRSDIKRANPKLTGGGSEWTIAMNLDISAYIKTIALSASDEKIVLAHLQRNGYIIGKMKKVNFKSRSRYNFIKIKDEIIPEFFPEEMAPGVVDSISEMLQSGVRIWHHGAPGKIMNYDTENWEVTVAKGVH